VANEVAARARWPVVYRAPEANSGGKGQSAETAGHQEEGETVCENLAGRRCPYREKRYPILTFPEVASVEVVLMERSDPSLGASEGALPPTAATPASAFLHATGHDA
jgi:hypothetical protein